jgi:hypothetical protein
MAKRRDWKVDYGEPVGKVVSLTLFVEWMYVDISRGSIKRRHVAVSKWYTKHSAVIFFRSIL